MIKVGDIVEFKISLMATNIGRVEEIIEIKESSLEERVGEKIYKVNIFDPTIKWIEVKSGEIVKAYSEKLVIIRR